MLYAVLALITAILAAGSFYLYTSSSVPNTLYIVAAIVCVLLTVVLGGLFLSGRVNKKEDIHITE
jgi:hypothetical protein